MQHPRVVFTALADETRWQILRRLGDAPASASALAERLPVSRQAIAKHLKILELAGLVTSERHGKQVVYHAIGARLSAVARDLDVVGRAWDKRLPSVERIAERPLPERVRGPRRP